MFSFYGCSADNISASDAALNIKSIIQDAINARDEDIPGLLQQFIDQSTLLVKFDHLNEEACMPAFWNKVFSVLNQVDIIPEVQVLCLKAIFVLCRESEQLDSVLSPDRLGTILHYAHISPDTYGTVDTDYRTVVALECLTNIFYNSSRAFEMTDSVAKVLDEIENSDSCLMTQLKIYDMDIIAWVSIFLADVQVQMKERYGIVHLIKKLECLESSVNLSLMTPEVDAICEVLKILSNISLNLTKNKKELDNCDYLVFLLRSLLCIAVLNIDKKILLHKNIVNVLINMPYTSLELLITDFKENANMSIACKFENYNIQAIFNLIDLFQNSFVKVENELEDLVPVLSVLVRSACCSKIINKYLHSKILPPLRRVHRTPAGNLFCNQLISLATKRSNVGRLATSLLFIATKENGFAINQGGPMSIPDKFMEITADYVLNILTQEYYTQHPIEERTDKFIEQLSILMQGVTLADK